MFDRGPWFRRITITDVSVLTFAVITGAAIAVLGAAWIDYVVTFGHYPNQGELATWLLQLTA